jgi:hypothetical protein
MMESIGAAVPSRAYHLQKGFEHGAPIHDSRGFLVRRACRTADRKVNDSDREFTRGKSENILWAAIDSVECTDCKEMVQKVEWSTGYRETHGQAVWSPWAWSLQIKAGPELLDVLSVSRVEWSMSGDGWRTTWTVLSVL